MRLKVTAGFGLAACAAATMIAAPSPASSASTNALPTACTTWSKSQVASGFGILENIEFDRRGGILLSETAAIGNGSIKRLAADGTKSTVVPNVPGPGGIEVEGSTAYYNTGNSPLSGALGLKDGTISAVNLDTGATRVVHKGFSMPNGLAKLPNGDFVVSRDLGLDTRLTRAKADGSGNEVYAPSLTSTNGLTYDATRQRLYVGSFINPTTTISGVDINNPSSAPTVATIPGFGPINGQDDITMGPDGNIYAALNIGGRVVRVNPDTGAVCTLADSVLLASSLDFGAGPGWDPNALYVTSFLGTVTKLTP